MSISEWVDKPTVVYTHNGILFCHKKESSTNTCYNMDGSPRLYAKGKQPDTEDHILYNLIYTKYAEEVIL